MKRFLFALALLSGSSAAFAQSFDYTYVDLGYAQGDVEDLDGDGWSLGGSMALTQSFTAIASYSTFDLDDFSSFDVNSKSIGLGFHSTISDALDLVLSASWVNGEVDLGSLGSYDENGFGLGVGLRTWLTNSLELNGGLDYVDFGGDGDNDTSIRAGLIYNITDGLGIGISGAWGNDPDSSLYTLHLRLNLGS